MSDSANGTSAPARSTASRTADGYGCSAVAMTRTLGRAPGSISMAARFIPSPDVPDITPTAIIRRFSRERRGDGFVHRDAEAVHRVVVPAAEVHAVREQDDGQIELRIDPERRAGETRVPVGVDAEMATDHRPVRRAEREADAAPHVAVLDVLRPRERGEIVADDGAVAKDPCDRRHIRGRPEEARVSRRPRERERVLVVDLTAEASHPPLGVLLGRDAALGETRAEVRVERIDRPEDPLAHQLPERLSTDRGERLREHDVAEVAVGERAKVLGERLLRGAPQCLFPGLRLLPEWEPPLEAGGVRQHVPERDVVLPTTAEIGDELAEGSVQRNDPDRKSVV